MENTVFHKADSRGDANHGWLHSKHTFSFANYYNPERMNFGVLRVLNDDSVSGGMGFGAHPHDNMEIVSIPLQGDLAHKDSMGNSAVIKSGDIQVMSAGTGITHSEFNNSKDQPVKFLQIWIFPNKRDVTPRYDQITLNPADRKNKLQQIISPDPNNAGVWVHQNAWFHLGDFEKGITVDYNLKSPGNGLYIFNLSGELKVNDQVLETRDGYGLWNIDTITLSANSNTEFLIMEVPMTL
jgi:redox-sensitive bicupin YhaK (pirin superfamily)